MKTILALVAAITVATPAMVLAADDCPDVPRDQWMSDAAITQKAKEQGYEVRSIKAEDGCLEAYAINKDGKRVEVYFHPGTGDVLKVSDND